MQDGLLSNAEFSGVVGTIYDCALDPALWPDAIREVCGVTNCVAGLIEVSDLETRMARLHQIWNYDADLLARMHQMHGAEVAGFWASVPNLMTRPYDEPLTAMRDLPPGVLRSSRFYNEWALPQGYFDTVQLVVMRQRDRIGAIGLSRHVSAGDVTDRDLDVVRLLAPHIRRAVAISDVLNMQAIKIGTFESALDLLQAGVLLVDRDCRIIHANDAARAMLQEGSPIQSVRGELRTHLPQTTAALKKAVAVAVEPAIGRSGIGVPLPRADGDPAHVHVLPLMSGETRSRLAPGASAALFVTVKGKADPPAEAIAALFDLSPAEIRIVQHLLAGKTPVEIADELGLALPTVRTHLARIFAKTGTSRQADLILLATQIAAPVKPAVATG